TSVYSDFEPWRFQWVSDDELEAPEEAPQSLGQAPPSLDYVPGLEHPPSPDYVLGLEELEQTPLSPDYVPEPEYPEYLVPSDAEAPIEDQPLLADASPTTLSLGYVADSNLEKDLEEDPANYPADGRDDDESSRYDADDKDEEETSEEEEDDDEDEEHLALADSFVVPAVDPVPSAEDIEAFETNESAPTPPSPRPRKARIFVGLEPPMAASIEARIVEYAAAPTPPLPLPSPPTHTSPTYAEAPLGYRAAAIQWRAASPSTHHPLEIQSPPLLLPSTTHRDDLPEVDMPLQKRARFTALTGRFEVGESSSAIAARQTGHTLAHRVEYGFVDTVDASIRASKSRAMTVVGEDDRALLRTQVSLLTREMRYFYSMASSYEREAVITRQAWAHSKSRSQVMEAQIRALQRDVDVLQRQGIRD
ncbi:hypothetical protein Tco_1572686, partial [Tanacetum coccineum]